MPRDEDIRRVLSERASRASFVCPPPDLAPRLARARRRRRRGVAASAIAVILVMAAAGYGAYDALKPAPRLIVTDREIADSETGGEPQAETSWRAAQIRDYFALWSGNVETIPEKPLSLPADFFERPRELPEAAIVPKALVYEPAQLQKPLWVFASEADQTDELLTRVANALKESRPVVVFGAGEEELRRLFPGAAQFLTFPPDVTAGRIFAAWHPEGHYRSSTLLGPLVQLDGRNHAWTKTEPQLYTGGEEVLWQMAALTLWKNWDDARRDASELSDDPHSPANRGPYSQSETSVLWRWGWENGVGWENFIEFSPSRPFTGFADAEIPFPRRVPPGAVTNSRHFGPKLTYERVEGPFAPGEREREESYLEARADYFVLRGYDGFKHVVLDDEWERVVSPDVPRMAASGPTTAASTTTSGPEPQDDAGSSLRVAIEPPGLENSATPEVIIERPWGPEANWASLQRHASFGVSADGKTIGLVDLSQKEELQLFDSDGGKLSGRRLGLYTPHDSPLVGVWDVLVQSPTEVFMLFEHKKAFKVLQLTDEEGGTEHGYWIRPDARPSEVVISNSDVRVQGGPDGKSYPVVMDGRPVMMEDQAGQGRDGVFVGGGLYRVMLGDSKPTQGEIWEAPGRQFNLRAPTGYYIENIRPLALDQHGNLHVAVKLHAPSVGILSLFTAVLAIDPQGNKVSEMAVDVNVGGVSTDFDVTRDGTLYELRWDEKGFEVLRLISNAAGSRGVTF